MAHRSCVIRLCQQLGEMRHMNSRLVRTALATIPLLIVAIRFPQTQSVQSRTATSSAAAAKPLLLEKNDGERRLWRPEPGETDPGGFILKITPQTGSQHLMLLTEDMPPGAVIPTHKHLGQDEMVLIEKGTIHARVGDRERDLHGGGLVFIPAFTWVSLKNVGDTTASIVAIFSAPAFEDHLRCESVPPNEKPAPISRAEENACDRLGHVVYKDRSEEDPQKMK